MNEYMEQNPNLDLYLNFKQNWFDTLRIKSEKNKGVIQVRKSLSFTYKLLYFRFIKINF